MFEDENPFMHPRERRRKEFIKKINEIADTELSFEEREMLKDLFKK
jgi:hypothetical protein